MQCEGQANFCQSATANASVGALLPHREEQRSAWPFLTDDSVLKNGIKSLWHVIDSQACLKLFELRQVRDGVRAQ